MDLAVKYGADIAIFIHNLVFWVEKNKANGKHFYDGRYWTYNTMDAFAELYPLWSKDQIKRIISKCRDSGLVLAGEYNKDKRDRTKWYSPSDEILKLYGVDSDVCKRRNRHMQMAETPQLDGEIATALPDSIPEGLQITPCSPPGRQRKVCTDAHQEAVFEAFWRSYPRRVNKTRARRAWDKLSPDMDLCRKMAAALELFKSSPEWQRDDGAYIPHPATWLNNRRWEDEDIVNRPPNRPPDTAQPHWGWD